MRFQLVYKIINDYNCPNQLKGYLPRRLQQLDKKLFNAATKDWNDLPKSIRSITTFSILVVSDMIVFLIIIKVLLFLCNYVYISIITFM